MSAALDLAERALAAVRGADGAQATVTAERSLLQRFARSRATQATAVDDLTVTVTALRDGHTGAASSSGRDADALAACARAAEEAAEAAAHADRRGPYPGFPQPAPARPHEGHDPETALLDPAAGGAALAVAFEAAESAGVEAYGVWSAAEVETAIASTAGTAALDRVTDAFMKVTCIAPGGRSGYASATAVSSAAIDPRRLAETAAEKAASPEEATTLPPGEYPAVLEPQAVGELLSLLGRSAFNGLAYAEERSALSGRLGTRVAAPCVNLSDSPGYPGTLPRAFDAEGVPKAPLPLIQDGVAHAVAHDTRSAARAGATTTGHALAPGGVPGGPAPTNLVLLGGGARSAEQLCAPIERGVYVTRLWYANVVRPKETLVTAVTRDGTFLVEDGGIAAPLRDLRMTDSIIGILARTEALSERSVLTSEGEFFGRRFASGTVCPAVRAAGVRFTGVAAS